MTQDSTDTTATQAQHTPLPWLLDNDHHWYGPDGKTIIGTTYGEWKTDPHANGFEWPATANALFVARAVNSFDALVEALQGQLIEVIGGPKPGWHTRDCDDYYDNECTDRCEQVRAALAQAQADPPRWTPAAVAAAAQEGGA